MTEADPAIDRRALRRAVREYVEERDRPTWRGAKDALEYHPNLIQNELAALERSGFIYRVTDGDAEVLRLP